jgi:hypothetical protein
MYRDFFVLMLKGVRKLRRKPVFRKTVPEGQKRIARQFTAGKSVLNTMIQDYAGWA